jgi:hypothetical protein
MKRSMAMVVAVFATFGAASAVQAATYTYELNGNLNEANGGPALTANGGTLDANGYIFGANQGLTLGSLGVIDDYVLNVRFSFNDTSGYRKIVNFNQLQTDVGLYNSSGALNFYPVSSGGSIPQGRFVDISIWRLAGGVNISVGGINVISFDDKDNLAVINGALNFFIDDNSGGEAGSGRIDSISITSSKINSTPVPGPIAGAGLPAVLALGGFVAWRRRKAAAAT